MLPEFKPTLDYLLSVYGKNFRSTWATLNRVGTSDPRELSNSLFGKSAHLKVRKLDK